MVFWLWWTLVLQLGFGKAVISCQVVSQPRSSTTACCVPIFLRTSWTKILICSHLLGPVQVTAYCLGLVSLEHDRLVQSWRKHCPWWCTDAHVSLEVVFFPAPYLTLWLPTTNILCLLGKQFPGFQSPLTSCLHFSPALYFCSPLEAPVSCHSKGCLVFGLLLHKCQWENPYWRSLCLLGNLAGICIRSCCELEGLAQGRTWQRNIARLLLGWHILLCPRHHWMIISMAFVCLFCFL